MILETKRLKIRPVEWTDSKALFEYRSDKEVNQFQGFVPSSEAEMLSFIQKVNPEINQVGTWFQFVIILENQNEIIGDIGIHFLVEAQDQIEFGITINKEYQQKGFATEAAACVFHYLFNELKKHRIIASVDPRNTSSIKLFEKLNMRKEAHFKK